MPSVNFVLPDPNSPVRIIISPICNSLAKFLAKDIVSSSDFDINYKKLKTPLIYD